MNETQKAIFFEIIIDFLVDSKNIQAAESFVIKVYSNDDNTKIPIRFLIDETPLEHIVIDYFKQEIVDECNGVNDYGEFIRLNCDLMRQKKIGYVNYYFDKHLTDELNKKLYKKS